MKLDNGAMLTADAGAFDDVFEHEAQADGGKIKFSTVGAVVSEKLEKGR